MPHIGYFPPVGFPKPLVIPPSAFLAGQDTEDWDVNANQLGNSVVTSAQYFWAPVLLPHGATVTKLTLYGYLASAANQVTLRLYRGDRTFNTITMAEVVITFAPGYQSAYDDTINSPVVDNLNYNYGLYVELDPDAAPGDALICGALIDWK